MAINFEEMVDKTAEDIVAVIGKGKAPDPFDLDRVLEPFKKYELTLAEWKQKVAALEVKDDATAGIATEMGVQVAGIVKTMENERKDTILNPDRFVRGINAFFRRFKGPLEGLKKDLKGKVGDYSYQQEMKRRKAEAEAKAEQERKQKEIDDAAKKHNIAPVELPTMVAPKKKAPIRSNSGSSSTRMKWTFEITEAEKVPRQFLTVDPKAVQRAIDGGIREIAGVRIYEKPIVSFRGG